MRYPFPGCEVLVNDLETECDRLHLRSCHCEYILGIFRPRKRHHAEDIIQTLFWPKQIEPFDHLTFVI